MGRSRAALVAIAIVAALALAGCLGGAANHDPANPVAEVHTAFGVIAIELFANKAPVTVANFVRYAEDGFYDGLIFHRVIDDFVIQGGGHWPNGTQAPTRDPIPLEIHPDLTHVDGAVGMARLLDDIDSATSQFYITDGKQHRLDDANRMRDRDERGFAVFGNVVEGMDVVRAIASVPTDSLDRPIENVAIERVAIRG